MKMNKKKLAVVSLVLCVAAIISMGSLAWFTADDYVDNTLKFSTDFAMDLIEHNGDKVVGKGDNHTGLTFKGLKPGDSISKDPTVINKSKEEAQWIKMTVTVDGADAWDTVITKAGGRLDAIFSGYSEDAWYHDAPTKSSGSYVMNFYLKEKLAAGANVALFTGITIPEKMELSDAKALGTTTIRISADAMQADAGTTVLAAFGVDASTLVNPPAES